MSANRLIVLNFCFRPAISVGSFSVVSHNSDIAFLTKIIFPFLNIIAIVYLHIFNIDY